MPIFNFGENQTNPDRQTLSSIGLDAARNRRTRDAPRVELSACESRMPNKRLNRRMRRVIFLTFSFTLATSAYCHQPAISVEDNNLHVVPTEVDSTVTNDKSFVAFQQLGCKTKGTEVALSESVSDGAWFITTANGCGWGSALAPIWIVREANSREKSLILSTGGYAMIASKQFHSGMADMIISAGTAGKNESTTYAFDGKLYLPKSRK